MIKKQIILLFCLFIFSVSFSSTYYVSTTGNDISNSGLSPVNPWRTLRFAGSKAMAGDTVFIKAGLYTKEIVTIKNSGKEKAPIVFQGYQKIPGDNPKFPFNPKEAINSIYIPVIEGVGNNNVIELINKHYIEIRNLGLTKGENGIFTFSNSSHFTIENVYTRENGFGTSSGGGIYIMNSSSFVIRSCTVTDAGMVNLIARQSNDGLIENCKSYAVGFTIDASDYHICIQDAQNITIQNCQAYNLHTYNGGAPGHGIGIKDEYKNGAYHNPHSSQNRIINCAVYDCGEYFFVAHEAYNNNFLNCRAIGHYENPLQNSWSQGINIRDGAHDNFFQNCKIEHTRTSISIQNTIEGPLNTDGTAATQTCYKNTLTNCTFINSSTGIEMWNADNNLFNNCVFDKAGNKSFINYVYNIKNQGNSIVNSVIMNTSGAFQLDSDNSGSKILFKNTKFWKNNFPMPVGEGNITKDPLLVSPAKKVYTPVSSKTNKL
jgi:parallel beta-helix repeat protein